MRKLKRVKRTSKNTPKTRQRAPHSLCDTQWSHPSASSHWERMRVFSVGSIGSVQFSSVAQLCLTLCNPRIPCPSPTPQACSNSCPSSQWCHPAISSSVIPFSSCLQSLPASGSFPMSQFFASGSQSIGASASASVLTMNIQDSFLLGLTGLISLQSKGLSRVFSNTTVQKHQFLSTQPSSWSNSHIHTWLLEQP